MFGILGGCNSSTGVQSGTVVDSEGVGSRLGIPSLGPHTHRHTHTPQHIFESVLVFAR